MDYQVTWSPQALDDVDATAEYIAKDSSLYAQSVVEQLIQQSRQLSYFPLRGRAVPELKNDAYREVFVHQYRMIYRVIDREVLIAAIIHGARLLDIDHRVTALDS